MPPSNLQAALEALLFSSDQPLPLTLLVESLDAPPAEVAEALVALESSYAARGAGVQLREITGDSLHHHERRELRPLFIAALGIGGSGNAGDVFRDDPYWRLRIGDGEPEATDHVTAAMQLLEGDHEFGTGGDRCGLRQLEHGLM